MARFKEFSPKKNEGKIVIQKGILSDVVRYAILEVKNVELAYPSNKSVVIKAGKDGFTVDVYVKIDYSESISETSFKIQEAIRHNVEAISDKHISTVNVFVNGVTFNEKATNSN